MVEKAELQTAYSKLEDVRKSQEQFVNDMNSLPERPDYHHVRDICNHHMKIGSVLQKETIENAKALFRTHLPPRLASDVIDFILESIDEGHYKKFGTDPGVGFALSGLPDSMMIEWDAITAALLKAVSDGEE